jgi:polyferredoxin
MDKMKYPRGLIRYATENGLRERLGRAQMFTRVLRPRVLVYATVLIAIALAFVTSLSMRHTFKVDVVRDRMTLARIVDDGQVENLYRLQLMNATERPQHYRIDVQGIADAALAGVGAVDAGSLDVQPAQSRWVTLAVRVPPQRANALGAGAHPIRFEVATASDPSAKVSERSTFVVPR